MSEGTLRNDVVEDDERVARVLFAPSYISEGRVAPTAFRWYRFKNGEVEDYISVLRDNGGEIEKQSRKFTARDDGDVRYGYTWLSAKDIRLINEVIIDSKVCLHPRPTKRLPNHAGIYVYIGEQLVDGNTPICAEVSIIQKLLANRCSEPIPFINNNLPCCSDGGEK